jgi:hypothetical protein
MKNTLKPMIVILLVLAACKSQSADRKPQFSADEYQRYEDAKKAALERILGPMHDSVGHAIVPFKAGGTVDMFYFPNGIPGTGFATMELIEPDGTGPRPNRIGTYELVAFTKHKVPGIAERKEGKSQSFNNTEARLNVIFTMIAVYSHEAILNPGETIELPWAKGEPNKCIVLADYDPKGVGFIINGKRHSLLLVMEIFRDEMLFAMKSGSAALFKLLKEAGHYPYSDLDRKSVLENLDKNVGPKQPRTSP